MGQGPDATGACQCLCSTEWGKLRITAEEAPAGVPTATTHTAASRSHSYRQAAVAVGGTNATKLKGAVLDVEVKATMAVGMQPLRAMVAGASVAAPTATAEARPGRHR